MPEGADPAQERQLLLAVANRPIDSNTTFSTGGDVSRFQRRTVPARAPDPSAPAPVASANTSGGATATFASVPTGPVVRVARGNSVTVVPVGAH